VVKGRQVTALGPSSQASECEGSKKDFPFGRNDEARVFALGVLAREISLKTFY